MIWIYPEQLLIELKKKLRSVYVLCGNDSYFLRDSYLNIVQSARMLNFNESVNVELDMYFDWESIFNLFRVSSLFEKRRIFLLKFPQNYPVTFLKKNVPLLSSFLHDDLVLILHVHESNQINKNNIWLQCFRKIGMFVDCNTPSYTRLMMWVENKAKNMKLVIEDLACQLLCYYYESNLTLLNQTLHNLFLIYPDGNLNFIRVKKIATDSALFNMHHWIESILIGKKQRSDRILKQLEHVGVDLELLLFKIKSEILMLTNIKYSMLQGESLFNLLKKYKIYKKYHGTLLSRAVNRLSLYQLHQAIELLVQIELTYKKNYMDLSRSSFELLSLILCCDKQVVLT
ncbi:DNA polymerase III subunit delta [Blochmannia endosymbiont of Camponotus sp. C-046]|uniref:DNA polymerase III subunit delta n=1 Tax=Blochmannia endosymbiont of Camponotus sp. C-046 TaxID=2945589 RepID=UPI0020252185|nr:DNA polymerase III subunit delta [Blochmannia endosymbiont of Camponotus sp. C-046]URJ28971.1 DNA polymerase III subunit delta [Blochmannia endosymbiont of Camponotus sp. C-046]